MCLSTPTTATDTSNGDTKSGTATTAAAATPTSCSSSSQCPNAAACNLKPNQTPTQFDCNGNEKSLDSSIIHRKTATKDTATTTDNSNTSSSLGYSEENAVYKEIQKSAKDSKDAIATEEYKPKIRWPDLGAQLFLHSGAVYGLYLLFSAKLYTFAWRK